MFPTMNFNKHRTRTAPSGYSKVRVPFHALRTAQLVSAMIVGAIMSFFMYHLTHDHWSTPWTFIVLAVVSLLTVAVLSITILLHCFSGLNPLFNLVLNSVLAGLWTMGFGMLSYYMWGTLTHYCDVSNWHDSTGIMVCRIYKAVFTFSLLGLVSTLAALTLDLHIHRLDASKGKHYRLDDLDNVDSKHRSSSAAAPYPLERDDNSNNSRYTDHTSSHPRQPLPSLHVSTYDSDNDGQDDNKHGRRSEAFEVPEHGYGAQSVSAGATRYNRSGYAIPEGQFAYDDVEDTGYHGPGAHEGGVLYGGR